MNNMIKKLAIFIAISTLVLTPVLALAQPATTDSGSTASASPSPSLPTSPSGSTANSTGETAPRTTNSGSSVTPTATNLPTSPSGSTVATNPNDAPLTTGSGSTAATNSGAPATTNSGSTAATPTPTPNPPAPTNTPGGSSSGSSSSSSGGSSGGFYSSGGSNAFCPLITSYLKMGAINNSTDVMKLQVFLKNHEGLNVDINGIFDQKTLNAVKVFQTKYQSTILGPWGSLDATGYVYITTLKKINELSCTIPLALTASDLAIINKFKLNQNSVASDSSIDQSNTGTIIAVANDTTGNNVVVLTGSSTDNTAAVNQASVLSRFWQFVKNIVKTIFRR
jgi:hypothetical protein